MGQREAFDDRKRLGIRPRERGGRRKIELVEPLIRVLRKSGLFVLQLAGSARQDFCTRRIFRLPVARGLNYGACHDTFSAKKTKTKSPTKVRITLAATVDGRRRT